MGEILFLSHRIPFPPNRGDKIRSHHILKALAQIAPVHVATLADDPADLEEETALAEMCQSYCLVSRRKPLAIAGLQALFRRIPVSLAAFHHPRLAAYVAQTLAQRPIDAIYVFSGQMGQYVPATFKGRLVLDFVDVDSAKFEAYAQGGRWPRKWIDAREGRVLAQEEARLARLADTSLLISGEEAALFRARLDPLDRVGCDVRVLRNGIDSGFFDSGKVAPSSAMQECCGPRLIFTGQMDYAPNIAAVRRAVDRLLPRLREPYPDLTFHVVGRNPTSEVRDLDGRNGCRVWGGVADIREWLAGADLALVPLEIARGVQNKVLEAMAMALPVVLTPAAASGIGGVDGRHYAVAQSDDELVAATVRMLGDAAHRAMLGREARSLVVDALSWEATLAPLQDLVGTPQQGARHAA